MGRLELDTAERRYRLFSSEHRGWCFEVVTMESDDGQRWQARVEIAGLGARNETEAMDKLHEAVAVFLEMMPGKAKP